MLVVSGILWYKNHLPNSLIISPAIIVVTLYGYVVPILLAALQTQNKIFGSWLDVLKKFTNLPEKNIFPSLVHKCASYLSNITWNMYREGAFMSKLILFWTVFRIRIHWFRLRIQAVAESGSWSRPKFLWQNFFFLKPPYVFLNPDKGHSGSRRSLQPNKKSFNHKIS